MASNDQTTIAGGNDEEGQSSKFDTFCDPGMDTADFALLETRRSNRFKL